MSHHPTPLTTLLDVCDAVFELDAPALVGLSSSGSGWCLESVLPVDDLDDLIGLCAPPEWDGLAFVATGKSHPIGDRTSERLRFTYALDRSEACAATITTESGTHRLPDGDVMPSGRVADYMRRVLGLPTAPEAVQPDDLGAPAEWRTWDELREEIISTGLGFFGLSAHEVEWFDGPSFGRFVLDMLHIADGATRQMADVTTRSRR